MAKGAGEKSPVLYSAVNLRYIQNEDQHTRPRRLTKFVCKQGSPDNLVGTFIADLALQILSFRENIRKEKFYRCLEKYSDSRYNYHINLCVPEFAKGGN